MKVGSHSPRFAAKILCMAYMATFILEIKGLTVWVSPELKYGTLPEIYIMFERAHEFKRLQLTVSDGSAAVYSCIVQPGMGRDIHENMVALRNNKRDTEELYVITYLSSFYKT
ncbi:hypothetical protein EGW08_022504, partial [Elysia chlorotica]